LRTFVRFTPTVTVVERHCHFTLWSKVKALELLSRHFALLVERHEINFTQEMLVKISLSSDLALQEFLRLMPQHPEKALQLIEGKKAS
jgi:hypothetical protein